MIPLYDRNPTRRTPFITLALILVNSAVFIYMLFLKGTQLDIFIYRFSVVPWEIIHGGQLPGYALQGLFSVTPAEVPHKFVYPSLVTSMFLHDGWLHIGGNMIFLWIFGNNIEDVMGHLPFTFFYLVCGLLGTLAYIAVQTNSINPLLGASGAISGVLGAYLILYPRAWIYTLVLFFIIPIPAFVVIGFWVFLQLFEGLTSGMGGGAGVAWFAHLGGVAAGLVITGAFYPLLRRRRDEIARKPAKHWWQ